MKRIAKILENPQYIDYLNRNAEAEKDRVFCHHDLCHAVDVARVAYIMVLENRLMIKKDIIYAAALLHDIGRWKEYAQGLDHAEVSAQLAVDILIDSGFNSEERDFILRAIRDHRKDGNQSTFFSSVLYKSDKMSRLCNECLAREQCKRFSDGRQPELYY
ncbi:MAG: uncharacterized protein PWR27_862 [Petroclostridium sp.]|uniref:HD domain-containing protein n=1 Tax=Petroclostridium xylanilyticum TaxID=1792311 RepID=UPI000B982953|nr:HD domain-containing protein [Petroclostridium xylanilyticum]MBZ4644922.1 metal dependent phosphohydrolase [Clostridia bacterium]MDK2810153.1 uncharacterized protein [Petroclostridium sp.]